jgi:hypothetical protein
MKHSIYIILIFVLFGCSNKEYYKLDKGELTTQGIERIDYYDGKNCFDWSDSETPKHSVTDKSKIKSIIEGINYSNSPGPWKGACWDKICIVKSDTTIVLNTNGQVIGTGASGQFYRFEDPNFIKTHFK